MTNASTDRASAPSRRAALTGLIGGAGAAVLAGCAAPEGVKPARAPGGGGTARPTAPDGAPRPGP
ncbi:hypothetical protein ACH4NV_14580 [Streptomyces althioticus]|uniref:hypothetical protein n=1 Tax=Streptomyces althioticus TaxID=83380 RepID=UPI00378CE228